MCVRTYAHARCRTHKTWSIIDTNRNTHLLRDTYRQVHARTHADKFETYTLKHAERRCTDVYTYAY